MRGFLFLGMMGVAGLIASPAAAQMCGGGQIATQAQAAPLSPMCGMGAAAAPATGQQPSQAQASSGCGCCQRMAMMQAPTGPNQDAMPNMQMPAPGGSSEPPKP